MPWSRLWIRHSCAWKASAVGEPDDIANIAAEKLADGYQRMQIKISGRPVEIDIEVVHKVWERVGNQLRLAIDGNRGLTTRDALLLSQACSHIPFVFEQPCDTLQEIRVIRSQLNHPVYIDESAVDLPTCINAAGTGLVDGFGMKLTRIGGLFPMSCFRDICEARHLPHTADDAWGGDIIAAACVHMGATVNPKTFEGTWLAQPYIARPAVHRRSLRFRQRHCSRKRLYPVTHWARLGGRAGRRHF